VYDASADEGAAPNFELVTELGELAAAGETSISPAAHGQEGLQDFNPAARSDTCLDLQKPAPDRAPEVSQRVSLHATTVVFCFL
jgi:hypothetical protein